MSTLTRRECLAALASAAVFPRAQKTTGKAMRGAFMILSTPFTAAGEVDFDDLAREVRFVERCGAQGMVWPQGSSSVANLTRDERLRGMDVLAKASQGMKAVLVLGVQGRDTAEMLEYARRAEALAPDALIAMPPSTATSVGRLPRIFPPARPGDEAPRHHPDEWWRARYLTARRVDCRTGPRVSARRLRQRGIGTARRADAGRTAATPAAQGRVRRVVRRRVAVRNAPRPRRRDHRHGDVRGSHGAHLVAAPARRRPSGCATRTASFC